MISAKIGRWSKRELGYYEILKAKAQSALSPEEMDNPRPVLARFDDSWQFVFETERLADGKVVVFLPGAPDPWSGSICVVTDDRVTQLDVTIHAAVNMMKRLGRGTAATLQDTVALSDS